MSDINVTVVEETITIAVPQTVAAHKIDPHAHPGIYQHGVSVVAATDLPAPDRTWVVDDELVVPVGANETWTFLFAVYYEATSASDFQLGVTGPSDITSMMVGLAGLSDGSGNAVGATRWASDTDDFEQGSVAIQPVGGIGLGSDLFAWVTCSLTTGATAGDVALRFRQDDPDPGNPALRLAGSFLQASKVQ